MGDIRYSNNGGLITNYHAWIDMIASIDEEDQWIEEYLAGIRNSMVQTSTPYSTKDSGDGEGEMMPDDDSDDGENYAPSDDEDDSNN